MLVLLPPRPSGRDARRDAAADAGAEAKKIEDGARRDAYGAAERLCLALSVDA